MYITVCGCVYQDTVDTIDFQPAIIIDIELVRQINELT